MSTSQLGLFEPQKPARSIRSTLCIEFDGGTSCNIPSQGYGNGYGSYQIADREIVRCSFNRPMSANAAELFTVHAAITEAATICDPACTKLVIRGDSQIALKWVMNGYGQPIYKSRKAQKINKGSSEEFKNAIASVAEAVAKFAGVEVQWRGREHSVRLFGH